MGDFSETLWSPRFESASFASYLRWESGQLYCLNSFSLKKKFG